MTLLPFVRGHAVFDFISSLHGVIATWGPGVILGYLAVAAVSFLGLSRRSSGQANRPDQAAAHRQSRSGARKRRHKAR